MRIIIIKWSGFRLMFKHRVIDYVGIFFLGQMKYCCLSAINLCLLTYWNNTRKELKWNYMNYGTNCVLILHKWNDQRNNVKVENPFYITCSHQCVECMYINPSLPEIISWMCISSFTSIIYVCFGSSSRITLSYWITIFHPLPYYFDLYYRQQSETNARTNQWNAAKGKLQFLIISHFFFWTTRNSIRMHTIK